jgi:hypothetical protein
MGALSSWASMALVHHALVWYAAFTTGALCKQTSPMLRWSLFDAYLILGDDIMIADKDVAEAYSSIMQSLGIGIGLAKSFTDTPLANFANQTYLKETNISPLSLREELNVRGLPSRMEMALRAVRRGYVSLDKNGWVAPLLRLFVHPTTWDLIRSDLAKGINHPLVSWILSALLVPATNRLSVAKPAASIEEYMATMSRNVTLWNKPLKDLASCNTMRGSSEYARIYLLRQAHRLERDLKTLGERLETFEAFVLSSITMDVAKVLLIAFQGTSSRRLEWWRREYGSVVKQVILGSEHTLTDSAYARYCDHRSLSELIATLYKADNDLPKVPSFKGRTLKDFFKSERMSDETKFFRVYLRQMELLQATDEIANATSVPLP